jgi:hypothetical protein
MGHPLGVSGSDGLAARPSRGRRRRIRQQLDQKRAEGCTEVQGYFVSEPVSVGEIDRLLAAYEARRRAR